MSRTTFFTAAGRTAVPLVVLLLVWLVSGFYIVRGNEQAVIRRFGQLDRNPGGGVAVRSSGLRWDLPWPLTRVDRINTHEVRTMSIGQPEFDATLEEGNPDEFLVPVDPALQSQFLTGDRNILNLQVTIHYHVDDIAQFLFGIATPETRLRLLAESLVADTVTRCGVDFVHVLGRNRLKSLLVERLAQEPVQQLGLVIDDVTVGAVYPPIQVKSEFLEVMNARAERQTHINNATAYAGKRTFQREAEAQRIQFEAAAYKSRLISSARGEASRFNQLVSQIHREADSGPQDYLATRHLAMRRMYLDTMQTVFSRVAAKVLLDSGRAVDLTILKDPQQ
ncbi:MAG: protease modulator HflK [Planctomycetaceae bacterium]|jgi:membrane protease subunit HflK|nr:protease modulator HflK [Planctomycetaceae bacterium]